MSLIHDIAQAQTVLDMLAPNSEDFTFQTFDDNTDRKKEQGDKFVRVLHGSLDRYLKILKSNNNNGAGVFVSINQTDLKGTAKTNITSIRALVADFDTQDIDRFNRLMSLDKTHGLLLPSMIIESSKDKHHAYWIADGIPIDKYPQWVERIAYFFNDAFSDEVDTSLKDISKVIRLAGFNHCKVSSKKGLTGEPFLTKIVYQGQRYSIDDIEQFIDNLPAQPTANLTSKNTHNKILSSPILPQVFDDSQLPSLSAEQVRALARGRWQAILGQLDYHVSSDTKEHGQCPICGGADRFRFDDENGTGSFICSQGTGENIAGDGLRLLADHADMGIRAAVITVTAVLNDMGLISLYDDKTNHTSTDWADPETLSTDPTKETPYPIDAWQGNTREVIKAVTYYAQAPVAMVGQTMLGVMAHLGQRFVDSPMGSSHNPTSLIIITEGGSGSGKTQVMDFIFKEVFDYEQTKYKEYLELYNEHLASRKTEQETPQPINPQTVFKNATIESLLDRFVNEEMQNASWSTDDGAQFFNGHTMTGQTAGSALADLTDLYSGGTVDRTRSQKSNHANPRSKAYNVRMTLMLMAQRVILKPALTNELLNQQGFIPRSLFSFPDSMQGRRVYNDPKRSEQDPSADPVLLKYWERCRQLLTPLPIGDVREVLNSAIGNRKKIQWHDAQTEQFFADKRQEIENRQSKDGDLEFFTENASRMAENASRIASLMAYFDKKDTIDTDYIRRAFMLVEYSMSEFLRYQDASPQGKQNHSEKLSHWLMDKAKSKTPHKLNRTYISNNSPSPMRTSTKILQAELDKLESAGHIKQKMEGSKNVVHINPKLYG